MGIRQENSINPRWTICSDRVFFLPRLSCTAWRIWSYFILSILRRMLSQLFLHQLRSVFTVLQWRSLQRDAAPSTPHAVNWRPHVYMHTYMYMYLYVHTTLYFPPQTFPDPPLALIYHLHKAHQWIRVCVLINHVHVWAGNKSTCTRDHRLYFLLHKETFMAWTHAKLRRHGRSIMLSFC